MPENQFSFPGGFWLWPVSPLPPTICVGRQPYVLAPNVWWVGNSMHDDDNGEDGKELSKQCWWCMLVMGRGSLLPIRFGAMTTELTIIEIVLKNYLNPIEVLGWPTNWRLWHTSTWTTRGGLSHTVVRCWRTYAATTDGTDVVAVAAWRRPDDLGRPLTQRTYLRCWWTYAWNLTAPTLTTTSWQNWRREW